MLDGKFISIILPKLALFAYGVYLTCAAPGSGVFLCTHMKNEYSAGTIKSQFSDRLQAVQERLGDTARNVSRSTDEYVHENPWQMIGIAAAAALLLGFLIGTTRR